MERSCETCAFMHRIRSPEEPEAVIHHLCEMATNAIRVIHLEGEDRIVFNCHESMLPCKKWVKAPEVEPEQDEWVYRHMIRNRERFRRKKKK